jgi:peptide/nickel transport system substrate-binding protein
MSQHLPRSTPRRRFLHQGGLALAALGSSGPLRALAQAGQTLTIAYHVDLPSWDPTVGPSAVNPDRKSVV